MAVHESTGFAQQILGPQAFDTIFRDGVIDVYSGTQPASADAAATGTLLGRITRNGLPFVAGSPTNGLRFIRSGRYALNDPSYPWRFTGAAAGVAGWFRLKGNAADDDAISITLPRIDGVVGLVGATTDVQLFLNQVDITVSLGIDIPQWLYAIPPLS